jgi:hypothetical protein
MTADEGAGRLGGGPGGGQSPGPLLPGADRPERSRGPLSGRNREARTAGRRLRRRRPPPAALSAPGPDGRPDGRWPINDHLKKTKEEKGKT